MRVLRFRDPNEDVKQPGKRAKVEFTPFAEKKTLLAPEDWQPSDLAYLPSLQSQTHPFAASQAFPRHPALSPASRSTLLDWLLTVCSELHLTRSTFHLSLLLCDSHLLLSAPIPQSRYQLLGLACLYIAVKVEESWLPHISEVLYTAGDAFTEKELLEMERRVLISAQWRLPGASLEDWIQWGMDQWDLFYIAIGGCSANLYRTNRVLVQAVQQMSDKVVLKWEFYEYERSLLAAAGLYKALLSLGAEADRVQKCYWVFAEKVFGQMWSEKVLEVLRFLVVC